MNRFVRGLMLAALASSALLACGGQSDDSDQARGGGGGTDSNTHWLGRCTEDSDCANDLQCVCGVCSVSCDEPERCEELEGAAQCIEVMCDVETTTRTSLCSKGCQDDTECPGEGSCDQGVCVPRVANLPPEPSACAAMDIQDAQLPCDSAVEFYWDGERCAPMATCSCDGDDCEAMFEAEASCLQTYSECVDTPAPEISVDGGPEPTVDEPMGGPDPDALPESCAWLFEPSEQQDACNNALSAELCAAMVSDGRVHAFECQIAGGIELDGAQIDLSADERAARTECVARWLELTSATDIVQGDAVVGPHIVRASDSFSEVGALFSVPGLSCSPRCSADTCEYCHELDEAACGVDPFCWSDTGRRLDEEQGCLLPTEFATCLPYDVECGRAFGAARDPEGQCWTFGWVCNEPGFVYTESDTDTCHANYPECGDLPAPVLGCEAQDAHTEELMCEEAGELFAWNGTTCASIACGCEGNDCSWIYDSYDTCMGSWAGCNDEIPTCSDERVPLQQAAGYSWGGSEPPDPALAEWTVTAWPEPFELPAEPLPCSDVEGLEGWACGSTKGVTFELGFAEPLRTSLTLPNEAWATLDATVGAEIMLRMTATEFAVTERGWPLILIGRGDELGGKVGTWSFPLLEVQTTSPFCKRPDTEEPDCNWLQVEQNLRVTYFGSEVSEGGFLDLEPFRDGELPLSDDVSSALYHVRHGRSMFVGSDKPMLETCGRAFAREDGFSIVRISSSDL